MDPITVAIVVYVSDKLLAQLIKEEGYGRLKLFFFPKKNYSTKIQEVLINVIQEYERLNSSNEFKDINKTYFYQSKIAFTELSKFILFKNIDKTLTIDSFKGEKNI